MAHKSSYIFVGDICWGYPQCLQFSDISCFHDAPCIADLEGPMVRECTKYPGRCEVFNNYSVIDLLRAHNIRYVVLANNHIFDLSVEGFLYTKSVLKEQHILYSGAGVDIAEASTPLFIDDEIILLTFGWMPIGCRPARKHSYGVNPLTYDHVITQVSQTRVEFPNHLIVIYMHWNYELSLYPQPMFRELAFHLIDMGVSLVIGNHCHRVCGIEVYKGIPIVYGLGNWAVPQRFFVRKTLAYPDYCNQQLAFEWTPLRKDHQCHWFNYDRSFNTVSYISSERLSASEKNASFTPFQGMNQSEYVQWFKKNNTERRKLLPFYCQGADLSKNKINTCLVWFRQLIIYFLVVLRIK